MPYPGEPGSSTDGTTPLILGCFGAAALLMAGGVLAFMLMRGGRPPVSTAVAMPVPVSVPVPPSPPPTPEPDPEPSLPAPETPPDEVTSGLPREVIQRVVRSHLSEVQRCYEHALETTPDLSVRVTATMTIDATGAVSEATLADSPDPELETCLLSRLRAWTFPAPEGGGTVVIHYPFVLEPG